jgi:hypothetical protein
LYCFGVDILALSHDHHIVTHVLLYIVGYPEIRGSFESYRQSSFQDLLRLDAPLVDLPGEAALSGASSPLESTTSSDG